MSLYFLLAASKIFYPCRNPKPFRRLLITALARTTCLVPKRSSFSSRTHRRFNDLTAPLRVCPPQPRQWRLSPVNQAFSAVTRPWQSRFLCGSRWLERLPRLSQGLPISKPQETCGLARSSAKFTLLHSRAKFFFLTPRVAI